jgi:hypothetical protein
MRTRQALMSMKLKLCALALCGLLPAAALASTCEETFRTEGDPRNGAEYFATKSVDSLGVAGALGQLSAIAAADGFNVLNLDTTAGTLVIEQAKGVKRPFLINLGAKKASLGSVLSIQTRLDRGVTAKSEDMRTNMCGMLNRVKGGAEGEKLGQAALAQSGPKPAVTITAIELARDLSRLKKEVGGDQAGADKITAKYKGKQFNIDGQVHEPLNLDSSVRLWFHTYKQPGILNTVEDNNSVLWATISCDMIGANAQRALKLQGKDWAKIRGVVSRYELGTPDKLVLTDCVFL